MKQLILALSVWLLTCSQFVLASSLVPADTIAGQARLARSLAAEACQQLASGPNRAATGQNPLQAQQAFEQALSQTIEKRTASIRQVASKATAAGAYERLRAYLPTAMAVLLVRTCPTAAQLYNQFSSSAATEDALIKSWGEELCQRLATLHTAGTFNGKSSAERVELFRQEFTTSLARRGPQIMQLYGADGNSQPVVARLAGRITEYMQQQCLPTLTLLKVNH